MQMVLSMKATGKGIRGMVMENSQGRMDTNIRDSGKKTSNMVRECLSQLRRTRCNVNLSKIRRMVRGFIRLRREIK